MCSMEKMLQGQIQFIRGASMLLWGKHRWCLPVKQPQSVAHTCPCQTVGESQGDCVGRAFWIGILPWRKSHYWHIVLQATVSLLKAYFCEYACHSQKVISVGILLMWLLVLLKQRSSSFCLNILPVHMISGRWYCWQHSFTYFPHLSSFGGEPWVSLSWHGAIAHLIGCLDWMQKCQFTVQLPGCKGKKTPVRFDVQQDWVGSWRGEEIWGNLGIQLFMAALYTTSYPNLQLFTCHPWQNFAHAEN